MDQNAQQELKQELDNLKVRCFDAEAARDKLIESCNNYNGALTQIADRLGVMKERDGQRVFNLEDVFESLDKIIRDDVSLRNEIVKLRHECMELKNNVVVVEDAVYDESQDREEPAIDIKK